MRFTGIGRVDDEAGVDVNERSGAVSSSEPESHASSPSHDVLSAYCLLNASTCAACGRAGGAVIPVRADPKSTSPSCCQRSSSSVHNLPSYLHHLLQLHPSMASSSRARLAAFFDADDDVEDASGASSVPVRLLRAPPEEVQAHTP